MYAKTQATRRPGAKLSAMVAVAVRRIFVARKPRCFADPAEKRRFDAARDQARFITPRSYVPF